MLERPLIRLADGPERRVTKYENDFYGLFGRKVCWDGTFSSRRNGARLSLTLAVPHKDTF